MKKDCRKCWPSFLGCCPKEPVKPVANEFFVNKKMLCVPKDELTLPERKLSQHRIAVSTFKKVKKDIQTWDEFHNEMKKVANINFNKTIREAHPVTYEQLVQLSHAIEAIKGKNDGISED